MAPSRAQRKESCPHKEMWVEGQGPHPTQDSRCMFFRVNWPAMELGTKVLIQWSQSWPLW